MIRAGARWCYRACMFNEWTGRMLVIASLVGVGCSPTTNEGGMGSGTSGGSTGSPALFCPDFPAPDAVACVAPGTAQVEFSVTPAVELDETCIVDGVTDGTGAVSIRLDCPTGLIQLEISSGPFYGVPVGVGDEVAVHNTPRVLGELYEHILTLRSAEGDLLFGGIDVAEVASIDDGLLEPLSLSVLPTTCELYDNGCFHAQAAVLRTELEGATLDLGPGQEGDLGAGASYEVVVEELDRIECDGQFCDVFVHGRLHAVFYRL